ncbi:kielin/chordin-like protein [Mya arenaria]|uniref:kielin/chordin-like protein n=1 Tax=Mya arenaria TaxID=6604 RepID=UPI0022E332B2|nr:kielin/chordin-like protein [Mya arenaria]
MCPQNQRYYAPDSCCDSCKCLVDGQLFPKGEFKDPSDQCNTCECFDDGNYECKKRPCEEALCGVNRQEKEYCGCHVCDESCRNVKCPQIECPKGRKAYSPDSCCESCFCMAGGQMQPKGPFDDPADPCKTCECYADGDYACRQRACPVPQCGLNKQIKDACGCPVCDDSCRHVKCAKVDCPNGRAAYDPDSCCESCFCVVGGKLITEGPFVDTAYPCKTCECYPKGDYNCQQQACPIPRCGVKKQIKDKCGCPVCVDSCKYARCPTVVCPENQKYFEPDSCCETCQCLVDGKWIPEGPFGDRCDACVCKWGTVKCSPPACPIKPLQCVDPIINENCNWHCPNGLESLAKYTTQSGRVGGERDGEVYQYGGAGGSAGLFDLFWASKRRQNPLNLVSEESLGRQCHERYIEMDVRMMLEWDSYDTHETTCEDFLKNVGAIYSDR